MSRPIRLALALLLGTATAATAQPTPPAAVECDDRGECFVDAEALAAAGAVDLAPAIELVTPRPTKAKIKLAAKPTITTFDGATRTAKACAGGGACVAADASIEGWRIELGGRGVNVTVIERPKLLGFDPTKGITGAPEAVPEVAAKVLALLDDGWTTKCAHCQDTPKEPPLFVAPGKPPPPVQARAAVPAAPAPLGPEITNPDAQLGPFVVGASVGLAAARRPRERSGIPDDVSFIDVVVVGGARDFRCTGVLVAPRVVVTAAHCLPATRVGFGSNVRELVAVIAVASAQRHPDGLDAAALVLAEPAPFTPRPRRPATAAAAPRGAVRIMGYGASDARGTAGFGVKRHGGVLVNGWGCDGRRPALLGCDAGREMVIAPDSARDTCSGDSGGPVLESSGATWRVLAITSRPARGRENCGGGGIYVRADAIAAWLDPLIEEHR